MEECTITEQIVLGVTESRALEIVDHLDNFVKSVSIISSAPITIADFIKICDTAAKEFTSNQNELNLAYILIGMSIQKIFFGNGD